MRSIWLLLLAGAVDCLPASEAASGDTATYVVYPENNNNKTQVDKIDDKLKKLVKDNSKIEAVKSSSLGTLFWTLPLDNSSAADVGKIDGVYSCYKQCVSSCSPENDSDCTNGCLDPTIELVYQSKKPSNDDQTDLKFPLSLTFVSQPNPKSIDDRSIKGRYFFDDSTGDGVKTYIVDSGATLSHKEFDVIRDKTRWIQVGTDEDGDTKEDDSMNSKRGYHGTSMLSLVAGRTLGVAKLIDPIIVRMPKSKPRPGEDVGVAIFSPENFIKALNKIDEDLGDAPDNPPATARAIVLMAVYFKPAAFPGGPNTRWVDELSQLCDKLISKGAVLVTGSGNDPFNRDRSQMEIDGWPANFAKVQSDNYKPSLIVAGGLIRNIGDDLYKPFFAEDRAQKVPNVWAFGTGNTVADGAPGRDNGYRTESIGTSDAAATTAGLVAYFVKLFQLGKLKDENGNIITISGTPESIKTHVTDLAYSRRLYLGNYYYAIWNGEGNNLPDKVCEWEPPGQPSRREEDKRTCINPTATRTTTNSGKETKTG